MDSPRFSIIIPTLNSEAFIQKCIESVLTQTYSDFEIILLDGLSKDKTVEIVRLYQDQRIRIVVEEDNGIFDAMNKGIGLSRGTWLYFLGSDDVLYSTETLALVTAKCTAEVDVLYGNVYSTRFKGLHDGEFNENKILRRNICHQAIFFRRSVFDKIGIFDLRYKTNADWDHNMRWLLSADVNKRYCDLVIANYADGGLSSAAADKVFRSEQGIKYLVYSKGRFSRVTRIVLLLKQAKRALLARDFQLFSTVLAYTPEILKSATLK